MFIYLIAGIAIGAASVWLIYFSARREIVRIEEEKQLLHQEKHIVIEFMHNLVEAIGEGVEKEELYQRIVHAAILSSGALSACLFEKSEDNVLRGVAVEGLFPPQRDISKHSQSPNQTRAEFIEKVLKSESFELGESLIGSVAYSQKAILIKNAAKDPRVVKHKDSALVINSIIITPILFRKNALGVLAVANPVDSMPFTENDFSLVKSLAEQAGMAIHNLNLMTLYIEKSKLDFELSLASNIQNMLLPKAFPENSSLDIHTFYRPSHKIGGDLYDVFPLSENRIGFVVADVSGKGVPASILMAICQTHLRHFAHKFKSPAEVIKAMNREMISEMRQDMFITIVYAIIDTAKNEIILARAGHELPVLFKYNKRKKAYASEKVNCEGMALGMVESGLFDEIIEDVTIPFRPMDTFILYTDGITEAVDKNESEFGYGRLTETISNKIHNSAENINQNIIEKVEKFTNSAQNADDLTLVTVKHNEE